MCKGTQSLHKFDSLCFSFKRDLRVLSFLLTRLKSSSPLQLDNGLVKTGEHIKDHQGHRSDWIKDHIKTTSRIIKALLEKQLLGWDMLRPSNYAEGRGWVGRMIDPFPSWLEELPSFYHCLSRATMRGKVRWAWRCVWWLTLWTHLFGACWHWGDSLSLNVATGCHRPLQNPESFTDLAGTNIVTEA